ncbi:MAG: sulfopyruvate decarboxylase subunit beta [Candidatus Omnitrophica bacterium]|nr:sulfopyruvate decarboxylase subunit beta [Candidatus Omnitrophota bacterium]
MKTRDALQEIIPFVESNPAICATGHISREVQDIQDRKENFYVIGSMGMCSSIGLGVALVRPDRKVFVLDGDGSVLMNMGNLAVVGALAPKNFIHIVLDNEAYASTGNQKSLSSAVALAEVARANGYKTVYKSGSKENLKEVMKKVTQTDGPSFLLIKVGPDTDKPAPRVKAEPDFITQQFMEALNVHTSVHTA